MRRPKKNTLTRKKTANEPVAIPPELLDKVTALSDDSAGIDSLARQVKESGPEVIVALARQAREKTLPLLSRLLYDSETSVGEAAAEGLGAVHSEEAVRLLWQVAEAEPKERAKAARKSLYRLKAMGLPVDDLAPQVEIPTAPQRTSTERIYRAYTSHIDGVGSRYLILATQMPFRGLVQIVAVINDIVGVKDCVARDSSRRALAEDVEHLGKSATVVEADPAYVQYLLREAGELNTKSGFAYPENYLFLSDIIGEPDREFERPIIYELLDEASVREDPLLVTSSGDLLDMEEFSSWFFGLKEMEEYARQIQEREKSAIVLSEWSKEGAIEGIRKNAAEALFGGEEAPRFQRRLEEMAYVLLREDKEKESRQALAAALALRDNRPLSTIPFAMKMLQKSLDIATQAIEQGIRPQDVDYDPFSRIDEE